MPKPAALPSPTPAQAAALAAWRGPLLVVGGAGTGKTTLAGLAAVAAHSGDGPPPLLLAPSRSAASLLRNRIARTLGGTTQLGVTTVHALCRTLLERFSPLAGRRLLTAPEQEFRVRELLGGPRAADRWPDVLRPALRTRGFARQVRGVLARARQLGLDPDQVAEFGAAAGAPEWVAMGGFFAEYLDVLDAEEALDYSELVHRTRILLTEPEVTERLRAEIGAVVVDDLDDLDPAQIGLLRDLAADGGRLLATANPHAAVHGFRGAHPRIVADFPAIFAVAGTPAPVVVLAEGLRHGGELAGALASLGERLPQPVGLPLEPVPSGRAGGVRVLRCGGEVAQAQAIATELRRVHTEHGTDFSDMAVVVRSGRGQLPAIARALAASGIAVAVAADEIVLAASQAVRPLLLALQVVGRGSLEPAEAELLLTSPLGGFDPVGLRRLLRQWRAAHPDVTAPSSQEVFLAALAEPDWAQADTPEQARLRQLAGLLQTAREACGAGRRVDEVAWLLWEGTRWPARLRAESLRGGPAARHADRDLDAVAAFFELAAESSAGSGERGVRALLAEVAAQQIPADRERESRLGARGVQVLTAHRAKGREWSLVVVAGVQEGAWPATRRAAGVLEPLRLGSDGIGSRPDPREQLTEERRLFHLACSRARDHLVVTAAAGTEGEANQPSRFLAELGVPAGEPQPGPPVTLGELTARLRRVLLEPGSAEALRGAAAGVLADLSTRFDDQGRALAPAADPESWWGVRTVSSAGAPAAGPIRLSPSQVRELLTCPRHHFLNRSAHAGPPPAASASLGTVLHLLVQHANSGGLSPGEEEGYLDAAWEHLRFEAGWLSAVERAEAASSIGRFLAWRETAAAEVVGVEVPFELDLRLGELEVSLVGAVDRLERVADGRLRVVDFKTGRTVPSRGEVAGMEQLGIYQLAVQAGVLGGRGTAGALAVYLRHPGARDELPKVLTQDSLAEVPHLAEDAEARQFPTWVEHRVWRAARVVAEGEFPAAPGAHCRRCPFADSCPASGRGEQVV